MNLYFVYYLWVDPGNAKTFQVCVTQYARITHARCDWRGVKTALHPPPFTPDSFHVRERAVGLVSEFRLQPPVCLLKGVIVGDG